jgi:hypothetical protein
VHYFIGLEAYFHFKTSLFDAFGYLEVFEESQFIDRELQHEASRANAVRLSKFRSS